MKYFILFFFLFLLTNNTFSQDLTFDEGLYYEKPNNNDPSLDKYSKDNTSYKSNFIFIYDYYYTDRSGKKFKFLKSQTIKDENPLNLTNYPCTDNNCIDKVKLTINDELGLNFRPDSEDTQTMVSYDFLTKEPVTDNDISFGDEITGVIDNSKNIFIHPPRSFTFKILQLNPFPIYYLDEKINKWSWDLIIGGNHNLDNRWIDYSGDLNVKYEYLREKDEILNTPMGKISCKVVKATASAEYSNKLFKTYLKSYYNSEFGFVKLDYNNINGSKIVIDLIEIKKK